MFLLMSRLDLLQYRHELGGSTKDACLRTFPDLQCPRNLNAISYTAIYRTVIELVDYLMLWGCVKTIQMIS